MIFSEFKRIKAVILDVDGVLTDGSILVLESGEQLRTFHVRDGYAIQHAVRAGLHIWVISGGQSEGVKLRLQSLGVTHIFTRVTDKMSQVQDLASRYGIDLRDIAYIGDDIPDLIAMKAVGVAVCPRDAAEEIKAASHYVSAFLGGKGVVRDVLERLLKLQGKWTAAGGTTSI